MTRVRPKNRWPRRLEKKRAKEEASFVKPPGRLASRPGADHKSEIVQLEVIFLAGDSHLLPNHLQPHLPWATL